MKININCNFNNKLYKFKFIKNRITNINYHVFSIKKVLKIIYKISLHTKRILFLGICRKYSGFLNFLKLKTNHSFIPNNFWLNGLLSNLAIFKHIYLKKKLKFLFNLKLKHDFNLIVLFNRFKFENEVIKSSLLYIMINNNFIKNLVNLNRSDFKSRNFIFYSLIYFILKKSYNYNK